MAVSEDKMRESISDIRHSIGVDGYTEDQKDFLEALANRLEMIADGTFTQQPESEPVDALNILQDAVDLLQAEDGCIEQGSPFHFRILNFLDSMRQYPSPQPTTQVPAEVTYRDAPAHLWRSEARASWAIGFNTCRDAMLTAASIAEEREYPTALLRNINLFLTDAEKAPEFLSPNRVGPLLADVRQALKFAPPAGGE